MDITKVADDEKLRLCKWYFKGEPKPLTIFFIRKFIA